MNSLLGCNWSPRLQAGTDLNGDSTSLVHWHYSTSKTPQNAAFSLVEENKRVFKTICVSLSKAENDDWCLKLLKGCLRSLNAFMTACVGPDDSINSKIIQFGWRPPRV